MDWPTNKEFELDLKQEFYYEAGKLINSISTMPVDEDSVTITSRTTYTFTSGGQLSESKTNYSNGKQVVTSYVYDTNGKKVREENQYEIIHYEYDEYGNLIKENQDVGYGYYLMLYRYDSLNRITKKFSYFTK